MTKGRERLGKAVEDMVNEVIEDKVEERKRPEPQFEATPPEAGSPEEEAISHLFSNIPSGEGFYIKVYRRHPIPREYGGRPVFVYDIEQPEVIPDLEGELLRVGKLSAWPAGLYEVKLFKRGAPGVQGMAQLSLEFPITQAAPMLHVNAPQGKDPYEQLTETAKFIQGLTTQLGLGGQSQQNTEGVLRAVGEAYKAGIEAAKAAASNGKSEGEPKLVELLKAVKELSTPQKTPDVIEVVKALQSMLPQPRADSGDGALLDKLIKLKEVGLFGAPQVDPTERLVNLIIALKPLLEGGGGGGGGDGGRTTPVIELIRVLGPQLGGVVERVTGTIDKAINARLASSGIPPIPNVPIALPPQNSTEPQVTEQFKPIAEAINSHNVSYFPQLKDILLKGAGPQVYEDLGYGKYPLEAFLGQLKPHAGAFVVQPNAIAYFKEFLNWAKAAAPSSPAAPSNDGDIVSICRACGAEYDYDSIEAYNADPKCECGATTTLIPGEPDAPSPQGTSPASGDKRDAVPGVASIDTP